MSKDKDTKNKLKEHKNIAEVERLVDQIITKNREKLDEAYKKEIQSNRFSINNKINSSFYLKKNKEKKKSHKGISNKIISQARANLGEKPIKKEAFTPPFETKESFKPTENKNMRKDSVQKQKKESEIKDDTTSKIHDSKEILQSDEFEEVISDFEKESSVDINNEKSPDSKIIDENIEKTDLEKKTVKEKNHAEDKLKELTKKRGIFDKRKVGYKRKIPKNKKETDEIFDAFLDDDSSKIDENLKNDTADETNDSSLSNSDENIKEETKEERGIFFGRKNPKEDKKHTHEKQPSYSFKPRFHVENHPDDKRDSDSLILDEKLKNEEAVVETKDAFENVELKAQEYAKKHLKDKPKPSANPFKKSENKKNNELKNEDFSLENTDNDSEHVFFDEHEDSSFTGWSPNISDKQRKEILLPATDKPEDRPELSPESALGEVGDVELPKEVLSMDSVKLSDLGFSENEWDELDFYALSEPFAYVEILRERESLEKCYFLVEVEITEEEQDTLNFIRDTLLKMHIETEDLEKSGDDEYLASRVKKIIQEYNLQISEESLNKVLYYLSKTSLGLSKIDPLMNDPNIEDISCDGADVPLFLYHRKFGSLKSNVSFDTEEELSSFIFKLAQKCGKHISIAEPILDATMPDGSRIQMTLSDEITARGSTFTIRKFRSDPFSPPDLIEFNTMSSEMVAYMWLAIENGINMLFAGGTASGKTTALNALSLFIPPEAKIVSIEETREINLPHSNWIPGVSRSGFGSVVSDRVVGQIDMYDLMKAALRQRPEYIIVGEIRGREAYVLFQAMATGHATYSTVHADSAHSLIHRLEGKPINIPRVMLQSLDVVSLHVTTKVKNKRARRCKQIIEIIDIDPTTKEILTNEVFRWDPVEDNFVYSGKSYVLERVRAEKDMSREEITSEIKSRKKLVELMNKNNIREFRGVARIISKYLDNPSNTFSMMEKGAIKE